MSRRILIVVGAAALAIAFAGPAIADCAGHLKSVTVPTVTAQGGTAPANPAPQTPIPPTPSTGG